MIPDRDEPLIDACLDEVLAGRSPPNMAARIMHAHAAGRRGDPAVLPNELPGPALSRFDESVVVPPPIIGGANGRAVVELAPARVSAARKRATQEWQSLLVAASIIG